MLRNGKCKVRTKIKTNKYKVGYDFKDFEKILISFVTHSWKIRLTFFSIMNQTKYARKSWYKLF